MGDADDAEALQVKPVDGDFPTHIVPDIEVVNLSSQLTSMGLLTMKVEPKARKGQKRVRFATTEPKFESRSKSAKELEFRRREAADYRRVRRLITRPCAGDVLDASEVHDIDAMDVECTDVVCDDAECGTAKRRKRKEQENVNSNSNCATKDKGAVNSYGTNGTGRVKGKSKSDERLSSEQSCKAKKVVSKKKSVKDDSWCIKYILVKKRKSPDCAKGVKKFDSGESKKRKLSNGQNNAKKKMSALKIKKSNMKYNRYKSAVSKTHLKSKLKAKMQTKSTKSIEKLKKAKAAKKRLIKKANENRKLALKRKELLKRKLAEKKKSAKRLRERRKVPKKPKKIKIIPIERDEEVSSSLRVNLLKYLTIEKAYDHKYECCGRLCWDDWREPDIDDVIGDFE